MYAEDQTNYHGSVSQVYYIIMIRNSKSRLRERHADMIYSTKENLIKVKRNAKNIKSNLYVKDFFKYLSLKNNLKILF